MNALIQIEAREISGDTVQTCNARDLWEFIESKAQFADWIKGRIEKYGFVEGEDYVIQKLVNNPTGGRPTLDYHLTIETAKELAMVENNEKGRQVRRYFIACERRANQSAQQAAMNKFNVPQTYPEAMRLAADLAEQKVLAEQQRDEAIATKALIGSKREATAMATAAAAKREAHKLEVELDRSRMYATVKRIERDRPGQNFNWRVLKRTSEEVGIPAIDVFDQNYGTVKSYHAEVWRKAYAIEIDNTRRSANA